MNILYRFGWVIARAVSTLGRVRVLGLENVPQNEPFILASNHISFYDPPIVGCWLSREMFFLAKRNLFNLPIVGLVLRSVHAVPVNRGAIDRQAVALCIKALEENFGLVIFPEGTRSRTGDFLKPKAGIGMLAIQAKCAIVPVYVHGTNRLFACILGREQLSISYGEPLSKEWVSSFRAEKESYVKITAAVMERITLLRQKALCLK